MTFLLALTLCGIQKYETQSFNPLAAWFGHDDTRDFVFATPEIRERAIADPWRTRMHGYTLRADNWFQRRFFLVLELERLGD